MKIKSPAKINLALDILGKDESGYHVIQTVFHEINLHDIIEIEKIPKGIEIECTNKNVPTDETNTVYKAVKLLGLDGFRIKITKNIPPKSGLGGGSSNAAAVLKALAPDLKREELAKLAAKIGMDTPFFIYGGTALGTHFGEKITPLPKIKGLSIELDFHPNEISTKEAYSKIDLTLCGKNKDKTKEMIAAIRKGDTQKIIQNIHNDFQKTPSPPYLAGSGGTYFNIRLFPGARASK